MADIQTRMEHLRNELAEAGHMLARGQTSLRTVLKQAMAADRGARFADDWSDRSDELVSDIPAANFDLGVEKNPLESYFYNHSSGPGIWKWKHYFEIYHRHFAKFIGRRVDLVEIGIYSGGSLDMWRSYLGKECRIYGVDIEDACRVYENEQVSVFIGDQEDRSFWTRFKISVPAIDIVIDDGGHAPEQQIVTLEEMLPHLRPGGVYVCEDVHGVSNRFAAFCLGLIDRLNNVSPTGDPILSSNTSSFQRSVHSAHFYPYVTVIERHLVSPTVLVAPRQGSEWQPFRL